MPDLFRSLQRSFVYFPLAQEPPPVTSVLPGAEAIRFTTADGVALSGWFLPGRKGAVTVLVLNGNAGDRSHRAPLATALAREGFGVLLFDYRGYAGQAGTYSGAITRSSLSYSEAASAAASLVGDASPMRQPVMPSMCPSIHQPSSTERLGTPFSAAFMPLVPDPSSGFCGVFSHTSTPAQRSFASGISYARP